MVEALRTNEALVPSHDLLVFRVDAGKAEF